MARFNTSLAVQITDDFGRQVSFPIPFKIHRAAPIPEGFYQDRGARSLCPAPSEFEYRYILATFLNAQIPDGGTFKYPIPNRTGDTGIIALAKALTALGALCIDVVGERWTRVTNSVFAGTPPTFRTTPYDDIPGEPDKTSVDFQYSSDIIAEIGGIITLSTNYETLPEVLANTSSGCLLNPQVKQGVSVCSDSSLGIEPRRFNWKAAATDSQGGNTVDGIIARQSIVSNSASEQIINCLQNIAPNIYCSGYQGESIRNLQNLVNLTSA